MPGPEISEDQKKLMIEAIGEGLGKGTHDFFKEAEEKRKLDQERIDAKHGFITEKLNRIETKLDTLTEAYTAFAMGLHSPIQDLKDLVAMIEAQKS